MASTKERTFRINNKEAYAYKNTSCIKEVSIMKSKKCKECVMVINGIPFRYTSSTPAKWIWNISELRNAIRDYLGENEYESNCIRLEANFVFNQLKALQHYTLSVDECKGSIFTSELVIQFFPDKEIDTLDGEETVYISDEQKKHIREDEEKK